jgi:uncharacterized membrane protein
VTASARFHARTALIAAAGACIALVAHLTIVERFPAALGATLCLLPLAFVVVGVLRRTTHPGVTLLAIAAAAAALWMGWTSLERRFTDVLFVEHLAFNLGLAFFFGRTLAAGREPLCTRFARLLHGSLPPEVERYTARITLAWTLFFLAVAALAAALYAMRFIVAWSLLVNAGTPVLVGAMFAGEYLVRMRALPHWERVGVLEGMRAFARHFR